MVKYGEMQFQLALARAQAWHARIISGAYKLSRSQRATGLGLDGAFTWQDLTDEEKLADAIATMERHLKFAQECLDAAGERLETGP